MNIANLMSQLGKSSNPMAMMTSMLNPNQKQMANNFQNKSKQEQAEMIAKRANELGLTKDDLQQIYNSFKG